MTTVGAFAASGALAVSGALARSEELVACDAKRDHGLRDQAKRCYRALTLTSRDAWIRAEAYWALSDFKAANRWFADAMRAREDSPDIRTRWGRLYLETQQPGDASKLFREALELDPRHVDARLGTALVMLQGFQPGAREILEALMSEAPSHREVRLLAARLALEEGNQIGASALLEEVLAASEVEDAMRLEAYALLAAMDHLEGKQQSPWTDRALQQNPSYGEVYATIAYFHVIRRLYREAIAFYGKGVSLDPELWSAHTELGINLLRDNRFDEARTHLEMAYNGNPFSAQTVNTLRLLDSFDRFRVSTHRRGEQDITLRLHRDEAGVLSPYVLDLVERSIEHFTERYGFRLHEAVVVELYPQPADFAVRTVGMPGIGILGATFGYVVAMESPSARGIEDEFDWGSALWHEMAHVFTLEATHHQVPRWFSEGVSVFEEWTSGPTQQRGVSPLFLQALHEERLLPVGSLDQGFIRPSYRDQVAVSYVQSGLICQFIAEHWGIDALVKLLYQFDGKTPNGIAVERALEVAHEEFDERFLAYLDERFAPLAGTLGNWQTLVEAAGAAAGEGRWSDVVDLADEARFIYPEYVGVNSPYLVLAHARQVLGDASAARELRHEYWRRGGRRPKELMALAESLVARGDAGEAIAVLESVVWVAPLDGELHVRLGEILLEQGRAAEAAREFQVLLASDPHDKADAHYRLARAYDRLGASEQTRLHLLHSLEIAPAYRPAQKLLLEISRRP
jgi:tetratricopeptide (TPR) repeat protein